MLIPLRKFVMAVAALGLLAACQEDAPTAVTAAPAAPARPTVGCGAVATPISEIQGRSAIAPMLGKTASVEAVVTFAPSTALGGVFVQEEKEDRDGSPDTSEGLFIALDAAKSAKPGDLIRVSGTVAELGDAGKTLTALNELSEFQVCGSAKLPAETSLEQAPLVYAEWERYEAMRVHLDLPVTVIANYRLQSAGELLVSLSGRQYAPTQLHPVGEQANKLQEENMRNRIVLDDGSMAENPVKLTWLPMPISNEQPYRLGTRLGEVKGVLDERAGSYRLHVLEVPVAEQAPRPKQPPSVAGELKVASFNLLNLFNGDGKGAGFPTERGASSTSEALRQRQKLISAISAIRPDIAALMEIENDGDQRFSALAELVRELNASSGLGYVVVPAPDAASLGSDQIRVALIYRQTVLKPLGKSATLLTAPFDQRNRAPLLQSFSHPKSGGVFSVVSNHWKSKGGCDPAVPESADTGEGCWANARVAAAQALRDWIKSDPTASGDPDVLILGDLNAYAKEAPLKVLESAGYLHLIEGNPDRPSYSFSYDGFSGSLDHALVSETLKSQVTAADIWHINADEFTGFDYNEESPASKALFRRSPFRSSDHDPLIIGFNLSKAEAAQAATAPKQ
jgi:uncharacterized protein